MNALINSHAKVAAAAGHRLLRLTNFPGHPLSPLEHTSPQQPRQPSHLLHRLLQNLLSSLPQMKSAVVSSCTAPERGDDEVRARGGG
jgi:hypothetical protein